MPRLRTLHDDSRNFKRIFCKDNKRIVNSTPKTGLFKVKCATPDCPNYIISPKRKCDVCLGLIKKI